MTLEKVKPTVEEASNVFFDMLHTLELMKVPYILDGGTLLGFYRDKTFAEDDHDDIDITVSSELWSFADNMQNVIEMRGFDLYHRWERDEIKHRSGQMAFKKDGVKVDIMFKEYKKESDRVWWTVFGGPNKVTYKSVPAELLKEADYYKIELDLGSGKKGEVTTGIPKKVEEYLEYRYGNWKEKVHRKDYSCYTTDRCIVKENTYEKI